jgi:transcription termination/antitermination protein NusG
MERCECSFLGDGIAYLHKRPQMAASPPGLLLSKTEPCGAIWKGRSAYYPHIVAASRGLSRLREGVKTDLWPHVSYTLLTREGDAGGDFVLRTGRCLHDVVVDGRRASLTGPALVVSPVDQTGEIAASFPDARLGDWHVLHTKSRQEKIVAADLAAMGIAYFLPLVSQVRYYGNRKARVNTPLFPGYVFLRGSTEQAYQADRTKRIANIIRVAAQESLDWELRNLHLALTRQAPLMPYPYLKKGVRVEIRSGPFRGLQGIVEDRAGTDRLILSVDILGRSVSLEIDGALLQRLD